jgi:ABC-type multidrug transport system fused ATPase/permease subunit
MGFIMDGLDNEAYDRSYTDRQILRRIVTYFQRHLRVMAGVIMLIICASCLDALFPLLMSRGIDMLGNTLHASMTFVLIAFILFAAISSWICHLLREILTARAVGNVVWKLREDAFKAIMAHDMAFFDVFSAGKIATRVTSDTENFSSVVTLTLELLSQVLLFGLIAVVLCVINFKLALLTLAVMPLILAVSLGFRQLARKLTRHSQRSVGRINALLRESMIGITIAKNFRQEQRLYDEFQRINDQSYHVKVRSDLLFKALFPLLTFITNVGLVLVIYFGGLNVLHGTITIGEWFLFLQALALLWVPLTSIAAFWSQFQQGLAASERVFALLDAQSQLISLDHRPIERLRGEIEFKQVRFSYDQHHNVLDRFNLHIAPGETVALVGHTGAGKSSIGKLIARFYEFQQGEILIDGRDIRTLDMHDYHRHIGMVPQTPYLFSGSVADNIRYAYPSASDEEVERAASSIGNGYWLRALPQGLASMVGEEGKSLSLGQRQLIALARVRLQNPEILIMDEATASVDPLTEAQIQAALDLLTRNQTAIVIAHRLSTIQAADRILVLKEGQIVEEGNHETLLSLGGYYADLYTTYFRHQSAEYEPGAGTCALSH